MSSNVSTFNLSQTWKIFTNGVYLILEESLAIQYRRISYDMYANDIIQNVWMGIVSMYKTPSRQKQLIENSLRHLFNRRLLLIRLRRLFPPHKLAQDIRVTLSTRMSIRSIRIFIITISFTRVIAITLFLKNTQPKILQTVSLRHKTMQMSLRTYHLNILLSILLISII